MQSSAIGSSTACIDDSDCVSLGKPTLWTVYIKMYNVLAYLCTILKASFSIFNDK